MIISAIFRGIKAVVDAVAKAIAWLLLALGLWVPLLYSLLFVIVVVFFTNVPLGSTGTIYFFGLFVAFAGALWFSMMRSARKAKQRGRKKEGSYNVSEVKKKKADEVEVPEVPPTIANESEAVAPVAKPHEAPQPQPQQQSAVPVQEYSTAAQPVQQQPQQYAPQQYAPQQYAEPQPYQPPQGQYPPQQPTQYAPQPQQQYVEPPRQPAQQYDRREPQRQQYEPEPQRAEQADNRTPWNFNSTDTYGSPAWSGSEPWGDDNKPNNTADYEPRSRRADNEPQSWGEPTGPWNESRSRRQPEQSWDEPQSSPWNEGRSRRQPEQSWDEPQSSPWNDGRSRRQPEQSWDEPTSPWNEGRSRSRQPEQSWDEPQNSWNDRSRRQPEQSWNEPQSNQWNEPQVDTRDREYAREKPLPDEKPRIFKLREDPDMLVYEYSDRLVYYRKTQYGNEYIRTKMK